MKIEGCQLTARVALVAIMTVCVTAPVSSLAQVVLRPDQVASVRTHFARLNIGDSRTNVLATLGLPSMDEECSIGSSFEDHESYRLDHDEVLFLYFAHDRDTWRLNCAIIGSGVIHERFRSAMGMAQMS